MRMTVEERRELERIALLRGEKPSALARRFVIEGLQAVHVESTTPAASIDRR
jgi:hypothetical protein